MFCRTDTVANRSVLFCVPCLVWTTKLLYWLKTIILLPSITGIMRRCDQCATNCLGVCLLIVLLMRIHTCRRYESKTMTTVKGDKADLSFCNLILPFHAFIFHERLLPFLFVQLFDTCWLGGHTYCGSFVYLLWGDLPVSQYRFTPNYPSNGP